VLVSVPKVQYAKDGDLHIAYQVWGSGDIDLVLVWGMFSHCELFWEDPEMAHFLRSLGEFARVVQCDKRGTGMSDAIPGIPTLEDRMDDIRLVMDAVGMERAAFLGESEGGPTACLFAATYPDRVSSLVLYAPLLTIAHRDDVKGWVAPDEVEMFISDLVEVWGTGEVSTVGLPSRTEDPFARELCARFERLALSRGGFRDLMRANAKIDIDPVLPSITAPTLVVHRVDDMLVPAEQGRHYAEHIHGATFVGLEGIDHYVAAGDVDAVSREVRGFLTGTTEAGAEAPDRVLATVVFTDIVGSTERATELGDQRWRQVLDEHDRIVAADVALARGRVVKSTGDGALAIFDGPARAVRGALAIAADVRRLGVDVRAGVHTGEVELRGDDVGGIAVHIGSRVASAAGAGEVLTSRTVVDLVVGSGITFEERGAHELKGVPGQWELFAATR
jgi:class 3 adenylate cyclase/alpha-beta hydrolase superfamily lysophospholipase